jgi:hypothetical protein
MTKALSGLRAGAMAILGLAPAVSAATDVTIVALGGEAPVVDAKKKPADDMEDAAAPMVPPDDEEDDEDAKAAKKKKDKMDDDSAASATAAANTRWAAVLQSPEAANKTAAAVTMLTESTMSAAAIVKTLGALAAPQGGAALASLMEQANPDLGTGQDASASPEATAASAWDKAYAKLNPASRG